MTKLRVAIVDRTLVAEGLRRILQDAFLVTGAGCTPTQVIALFASQPPDVLLVDPSGINFLKFTDLLRAAAQVPNMKLLVLSERADQLALGHALQAGARGFLHKRQSPEQLCDAIRVVASGRMYVPPGMSDMLPQARVQKPLRDFSREASLTVRQREVLSLVAQGCTSKEIALLLHVSVKTIEFHRAGLMAVLGLHTIAELSRFALQHGIVEPVQ